MIWRRTTQRKADPDGPFGALRIALVADDLTRAALGTECQVVDVTPRNYRKVFSRKRPDFLLVESCWRGLRDAWRYRIAAYPDHPRRTNSALARVVEEARSQGIPAIFWNREDGVHYHRFIDSARLFDRVLTVDENMLPAYRRDLEPAARVGTMMFAASTMLHQPAADPSNRRAAFVGSYGTHIHDLRREWQDVMFDAASPLGLTIFDRNSDRKSRQYRFPDRPWIDICPAVPHDATARIYREYAVNLNVNTIVDSSTAFSRRLVEILSCGGMALTNDTKAVRAHFADFCRITNDEGVAKAFFERVASDGLSREDREMCRAGADHVSHHHSWRQRIPVLIEMAN